MSLLNQLPFLHRGTRQKKLTFLLACLAVFISLPCNADGRTAEPQAAQQLISSTALTLLSALETEGDALKNDRQRIEDMVEIHLLPHIEFSQISRLVLGKYWRTATPQQRVEFIHEFRHFLIRFYTTSLLEYTKENDIPKDVIQFLPLRASDNPNRATVRSLVSQPSTTHAIPVDYKLYANKEAEWKIYDVVVDGVSLIGNYRSNFSNEIRRRGMDGLITRLAERNAQMDKK